jgi:hypothetical protein
VIGEVRQQPAGTVLVTTLYGGSRIVDMLVGDPCRAFVREFVKCMNISFRDDDCL